MFRDSTSQAVNLKEFRINENWSFYSLMAKGTKFIYIIK
jgi:hypothetical protein